MIRSPEVPLLYSGVDLESETLHLMLDLEFPYLEISFDTALRRRSSLIEELISYCVCMIKVYCILDLICPIVNVRIEIIMKS